MWTPADYGHIEQLYISSSRVWIPPVILPSSFDLDDYYVNYERDVKVEKFRKIRDVE